jgi:S1-C subfamily serine protease
LPRSNVKDVPRLALILACAALVAPFAVAEVTHPPAVVTVRVWSGAGLAERATGTVVGPGEVLTVDHVVAGSDRVEVHGSDGVRRTATVMRRRAALDLAVLRVPGATGPAVRFSEADEELRVLTTREGVVRARPAGLRRRVVARLVDQPGRPRRPSLELAVTVAAGDSGAPVVDGDGDVVGVVYARSTRRVGTAYAVRGEGLRRFTR